jgi:Ca-activated chloride channel family protein
VTTISKKNQQFILFFVSSRVSSSFLSYFCPIGLRGDGGTSAVPKLGFAVGGAKDVNNFRENIQNNYLPIITDLSYEGLFNDYFFDTGNQQEDSNEKKLFCPSYSMAITKNPLQETIEQQSYEYYMTVGLNSNLNENTFKRNPMNLLICIDVSGSMASPFNRYHYDRHRSNTYVDKRKNCSALKYIF